MGSVPVSRLLLLAAIGAVVAVCAGSGLAGPARPQAVLTQATGDLLVANSQDGHAIFQATGLAPGRSVTGTVDLVNTGTLPGDLGLEQLDVQDQPGVNGGKLSSAIYLDITDVTGGNSVPIFTGQLGGLGSRSLGSIGPGEARSLRFTASLPDGGPPPSPGGGDNAYAGSGLTVRYAWTATATGPGPGGSGTTEPAVKIALNSKKLLTRGYLDVMTTCDVACRVSAYAQLPKAKRAKKAAKTKSRSATLTTPNKPARIRLKLSKKAKRQLLKTLRKKRRVAVKVTVAVSSASGGPVKTYTRKASVKRPRPKKRRRR
jgi:spore coat-associated protein N